MLSLIFKGSGDASVLTGMNLPTPSGSGSIIRFFEHPKAREYYPERNFCIKSSTVRYLIRHNPC